MDRASTTTLLRDARAGSPTALDALFARCAVRLLALVRVRMGPALRAQTEPRDVVQSSLLKAFVHWEDFERSDSRGLMAWLGRIAENEIRDLADYHARGRRDAGRRVELPEGLDGLAARLRSQTSQVALDEDFERLERGLDALAPDHREVIVLRKYEELSFDEIGRRLGRSPDACRMLLARAMTELAWRLGASS